MTQIDHISRGGELKYSAPAVDMMTVSIEKGFAASVYTPTEGTEQPGFNETPEEL